MFLSVYNYTMKLRKAGYMNGLNYCFNFSTTTQKNIEEIAENSKNQRKLYRGYHLRWSGSCTKRRCRSTYQRLLEPVEKHCKTGSVLWSSGEILLRYRKDELGIRNDHHTRRQDHPVYHQYLQTWSENRKGCYRRYRKLPGFQVALKLDHQPSGTVQRAG